MLSLRNEMKIFEMFIGPFHFGVIYVVRTQNFAKKPTRTRTYAYQRVTDVGFSENFAYVLNE